MSQDKSQTNGTPKDFRGAIGNAIADLSKPGPHALTKPLGEHVEDILYTHFMDRLRNDFCTAILNRESASELWDRITSREHLP